MRCARVLRPGRAADDRLAAVRPQSRGSRRGGRVHGRSRGRSGLDIRPVAEAIERALAAALGHGDEAIQALAFLGCHPFGEAAVEVRAGARAHPCHRAFQNRETGQQHLGREQPGDGAIEQRRWSVRAGPAQRGEEAVEAERDAEIGEGAIAVALADAGPWRQRPSLAPYVVMRSAETAIDSWSAAKRTAEAGASVGSSRKAPSRRTEPSWTATPRRLGSPRCSATKARSASSRGK